MKHLNMNKEIWIGIGTAGKTGEKKKKSPNKTDSATKNIFKVARTSSTYCFLITYRVFKVQITIYIWISTSDQINQHSARSIKPREFIGAGGFFFQCINQKKYTFFLITSRGLAMPTQAVCQ